MPGTTSFFTGMRSLDLFGGTDPHIAAVRRVRDVSDKIYLLDPNEYALTVLLSKLRSKMAINTKIEWLEDDFHVQYDTCTTGTGVLPTSTTDGTFDPDNVTRWRKWDLWYNGETGEVIMVTGVAGTTVTCIRGVDETPGTGPAAWTSGCMLYWIGNAVQTGGVNPDMISTITQGKYNFVQIFKDPFEVDNTANWVKLYGGKDMAWQRYKFGILHQRNQERGMWIGKKAELNADTGYPSGTPDIDTQSNVMGGVYEFISGGNVYANSGAFTEIEFEDFMPTVARFGNNVKFCFASPILLSIIATWGKEHLQVLPKDTTYGLHITRYRSPHCELNLINMKLFQDLLYGGTGTPALDWGKAGFILDLENLYLHYGRKTQLEMNIQPNNKDSTMDQYLTEVSLEVRSPLTHSYITGISRT